MPSKPATEPWANRPVRKQPTIPPTPCEAKTSSVSSTRMRNLSLVAKLQAMAVMAPIATAAGEPTKPAAGVIPTRPEMAPEQKPTADHLRSSL